MTRWKTLRNFVMIALAGAAFSPPFVAVEAQSGDSFDAYIQLLSARARREGVSEATLMRMTAGLTPNPRVIALDRQQPGVQPTPPPMAPYLGQHVDANRIAGGRRMYANAAAMIPAIERRYGVPGQVVMAIWGHETNYGSYTGDFDLARSLATLAWEGRRRALFEGEFIAVLKMVDQGVPVHWLKGSWAGAFGNPQFLPSVYLSTAVDGDGDGQRDIWRSRADTLHSIANYFRKAGWRTGEPWGVRASVPSGFDWPSVRHRLAPSTCGRVHDRLSAWKPVREWREQGVTPMATIREDTMASLFQPDGPGTRAFLLTGNYRVILQYNCSNYYAMSVGLLADEIVR